MTTVLWHRASLELVPPQPKVRWHRASLEGAAVLRPAVRWHRAALEGLAAVVVTSVIDRLVEPGTQITLSPQLAGGLVADSWAFRAIPSANGTPAVALEGSGGQRTFVAPSVMPPTNGSVQVGITASSGGAMSVERIVTITVLPRLHWVHDGVRWLGSNHKHVAP